MAVLVRATAMGYYDHVRKRVGAEFHMLDEHVVVKDGKLVSPKWVELVDASEAKPKKVARSPKKEVAHVSDEEVI